MCERLCVTKLCVGVTRSCMREMDAAGYHQAPRLPRKTNVDVTKCHACPANRKLMSPSATGDQARHQIQPVTCYTKPRWMSPPRLPRKVPRRQRPAAPKRATRAPRKTKVDVATCYACHAKCRSVTGDQRRPSAPPDPAQCHKRHACHAKRM